MAKPQYPREILPQKEWSQTITVGDILKDCPDTLLGHLLVGDYAHCIDDSAGEGMEFIRRESLPLERMINLSCSLLGTYFVLSFFHFLPDNEGKQPWKRGLEITEKLLVESNYNYYPNVVVVGWPLRRVENYPLPYPRKFAKQKEFADYQNKAIADAEERNCAIAQQEWANLAEDEENKNLHIANFTGEAQCNHAPTMLNYWHFTIDMYSAIDNKNPMKRISKGWSEKMGTTLQDFLCHSYVLLNSDEQVPKIANDIWTK